MPAYQQALLQSQQLQGGGAMHVLATDNAANFVNSLELKALYIGEVDGMMKLLKQFSDDAVAAAEKERRAFGKLIIIIDCYYCLLKLLMFLILFVLFFSFLFFF